MINPLESDEEYTPRNVRGLEHPQPRKMEYIKYLR